MYYRITGDSENFANFIPKDFSLDFAREFDGRSHKTNWTPLHFELTDPTDDRPTPELFTDYFLVCSKRLGDRLKDLCEDFAEFLPCTVGNDMLEYYVVNIVSIKDNVNYDKSNFIRFPTGRIMLFNKISFIEEITDPMFRISDLQYAFFFCTDAVKSIIEDLDIKGACLSSSLF
jgi:hypothetical protein